MAPVNIITKKGKSMNNNQNNQQIYYVGTYDNGSGYREFIDSPVETREEAERQLNRTFGMDEKVEECCYSKKHKCWITK